MRRISAKRMSFENHCGHLMYSIFLLWDFDHHRPQKEWKAVGYCDSARLDFRAGKGKYAVLLERVAKNGPWSSDDSLGEEVWLHIDWLDEAEWEAQFA